MEGFITSRPARVVCTALALVLVGGGLATHLSAEMGLWAAAGGAFLGVATALIGLGWFADDASSTVLGVVLLPLGLMLLMPITIYVAFFEKDYADLLLVASVALAFWSLRPARRVQRMVEAHRRLRVV
jgi:hypothetical protein